jgi:lipopolysaccharide transport system ATP-binding protein
MGDAAITVEGLGKRYRIGGGERYLALRDRLADLVRLRWRSGTAPTETFWALQDVSFTVPQGEVVGVIGRNGAGKSTLLKLLSRITEPTAGRAEVRGRVGSLLEVGTGFHPELTGRENIFLNGAIIGMTRAEIRRQFDAIVAFAEVERFLDTPVKHFSSGMYLRLAFAVAAHLDPEILLVDEVLAVGDAAFQRKCLGKMAEVTKAGRTVLFVSHNLGAMRGLCQRALWLEAGGLRADGPAAQVISDYLNAGAETKQLAEQLGSPRLQDPLFRWRDVQVLQDGQPVAVVFNGTPVEIRMDYEVLMPTSGLRVFIDVLDENRDLLIRSFHDEHADAVATVPAGRYRSVAEIPANLLANRTYWLHLQATIHNLRPLAGEGILLPLDVQRSSSINRAYPHEPNRAKLQPWINWRTVREDA